MHNIRASLGIASYQRIGVLAPPGAGSSIRNEMKKEISSDSVLWVRGLRAGAREFGIAFVDGALSSVTVSTDGVEAEAISLKEAAAIMRGFPYVEEGLLIGTRN